MAGAADVDQHAQAAQLVGKVVDGLAGPGVEEVLPSTKQRCPRCSTPAGCPRPLGVRVEGDADVEALAGEEPAVALPIPESAPVTMASRGCAAVVMPIRLPKRDGIALPAENRRLCASVRNSAVPDLGLDRKCPSA